MSQARRSGRKEFARPRSLAPAIESVSRNCSVSPPLGRGRVREGVVPSSGFPSSNYAAARRGTPFPAFPLREEGTPAILNSYGQQVCFPTFVT